MSLNNLNENSINLKWNEKWKDIFNHYQHDLRHAYYIQAMLRKNETHILEIAAGSFRDMAALRRTGIDCEGMDFSTEAVNLAKKYFPEFAEKIHAMSAFSLPFKDNYFDLSYHNGFWVLFDDEKIKKLAEEQARISKYRIIATVHNAHNIQFLNYFKEKKETDPLYDIRFFEKDEISNLMSKVCKTVEIIPVGKGKKYHEDALISQGVEDPKILHNYLVSSGLQHLNTSERLLCIGELQ